MFYLTTYFIQVHPSPFLLKVFICFVIFDYMSHWLVIEKIILVNQIVKIDMVVKLDILKSHEFLYECMLGCYIKWKLGGLNLLDPKKALNTQLCKWIFMVLKPWFIHGWSMQKNYLPNFFCKRLIWIFVKKFALKLLWIFVA